MGSSESKLSVASTPKPQPEAHKIIKTIRHGQLMDPRSPSTCIDRTPIQVTGTKASVEENVECPQQTFDPRSPTVGVVRTPARDAMRETVGSFARRLGMLFQSEVSDQVPQGHILPSCFNLGEEEEVVAVENEEVVVTEEDDVKEEGVVVNKQSSDEPLLSRQPSQTLTSMAEHATLLTTPVLPIEGLGSSSPFVLLEQDQAEAHMDTVDLSVEEAEEAKESPVHKRLSMSLITCHEGVAPAHLFTEVQVHVNPDSPLANADAEPTGEEHDQSPAAPSATVDADLPLSPALVLDIGVAADDKAPVASTPRRQPEEEEEAPQCTAPAITLALSAEPSQAPAREQRPSAGGIQCPTFDPRSPSQVVFKPQWLGKGFGTAGLRARGVRRSKGGSSPLAVRVAINNVNNENKGQSSMTKKNAKRLSQGRSPLQSLKNSSPKPSQMRLKASTPERHGQVEGRVLTVSMDKENR